jgi:hypothetical protein
MEIHSNPEGPLNYYYKFSNNGRFCAPRDADTVLIRLPNAKKWLPFKIIRPPGVRRSKKFSETFAESVIARLDYERIKKFEEKLSKTKIKPGKASGKLAYSYSRTITFKELKKSLGRSKLYYFTWLFKKKIEINPDNVHQVAEYLLPFVMKKFISRIMHYKPFGKGWRIYLRLMGAGKFIKIGRIKQFERMSDAQQRKFVYDQFGFSADREILMSLNGATGPVERLFSKMLLSFSKDANKKESNYFARIVLENAKGKFYITGLRIEFTEILDVSTKTTRRKRVRR